VSSGEAITAAHMARDVVAAGGTARLLATEFTARFLGGGADGAVTRLTPDLQANRRLWTTLVRDLAPHAIVFADYPLLFFPSGAAPLADDTWVDELDALDAALVTLDHLGYAQRSMTVYFGPPHLSMASATTPALPPRMQIALPSPIHEPGPVDGRRGRPFRAWIAPPALPDGDLRDVRMRYGGDADGLLVLHSAPNWGWRAARQWGLPYYPALSGLLASALAGAGRTVTVVSVNDGDLLTPVASGEVRVRNLGGLPPAEFERVLQASDLVLTENSVSVGLGKAVCAGRPAAVLRNSHRLVDLLATGDAEGVAFARGLEAARLGSVFPFEVFPIWSRGDLEALGIHRANRFADCFEWIEVFGGVATRSALRELLLSPVVRADLSARQADYAGAVAGLPGPHDLLAAIAAEAPSPA
jgi:hypothetical protein